MELVLIKENSVEWVTMWEKVATHPVNEGLENPKEAFNEGESWQYMGSLKEKDKVIHQLRHRKHPVTQNLYNLVFYASDNFSEDDINIGKKIK
jgi:hypothetical protein